ncbi:MAG: FAD-dependent oxidoreductase [Bacillota bacterium]|nr:FAD-dependent oxidoreductase [Bacillota bacterium]
MAENDIISLWQGTSSAPEREELHGDLKADTVVIGAGLSGVLTAYLLSQQGQNVVIVESNKTGGGVTKNTTAKITSQHRLIYNKLISKYGEELARQYAVANETAIKKYAEIIEQNKIDCGFMRLPAYVFTLDKPEKIEEEVEAATRLGIKATFADRIELPFSIAGAERFDDQAQFHPLKFLYSIAKDLKIYERTRALKVEDNVVFTDRGNITADNIVVASHFPFINMPGYYFVRMHQERSYVLAIKGTQQLNGMYVDESNDGLSFREYDEYLLLGGAGHRTGQNPGDCYERLRGEARSIYPGSEEVYHWSAQDCITPDDVPYIGNYSIKTPNMYVASGYGKWGMTSSMVSAMIISSKIMKQECQFSEIFSPKRNAPPSSAGQIIADTGMAAAKLIAEKLYVPTEKVSHLKNGEGDIVLLNDRKIGAYRDDDGKLYVVSTECPHLHCQLSWNKDEKSWDCPCHGSRFDYRGNLIDNPAQSSIAIELKEKDEAVAR